MLSKKEMKKVIKNVGNNYIDENTFITQSLKLLETIFDEVENFNVKKEYGEVYLNFRNSIDEKYICIFTDILDYSIRLLLHETYLLHNSVIDINIEFDKINKSPASNRKHFETAKEISELVIKKYYFSNCADKKIINYIDEYLPSNYTKNKDINRVVWYFIVCVVTFNKQVVLSESAKGDD